MDPHEREHLKRLVDKSDADDNTAYIREFKNSEKILADARTIEALKRSNKEMRTSDPDGFIELCREKAPFMFNAFTVLFNKLVADELNLAIFARMVHVLQNIENGIVDQHEGSVMVGKYLKEIYIDSAVRRGEKLDKEKLDKDNEANTVAPVEPKQMTWKEWRSIQNN